MSEEALGNDDSELKRRQELHDTLAAQARTDQQASSDSFDNQLLTFSSALLGLSLAFIKDIVPLKMAVWMPCLYLSWAVLALCILSTIASFRFGIEAQKKQGDYLYLYYIEQKEQYLNKKTGWTTAISWCSYIGSASFLLGLVLTISFAIKNVTYSRNYAGQQKTTETSQSDSTRCTSASENGKGQRSSPSSKDDSGKEQDGGKVASKHDSRTTSGKDGVDAAHQTEK
jgi:hypothetical protein